MVEGAPQSGYDAVLQIPWTYLEWGVRLWGALALLDSLGESLPIIFRTSAAPSPGLDRFSFLETVEFWHSNSTAAVLYDARDTERQMLRRTLAIYGGTPIAENYFGSPGSLESGLLRLQLTLSLLGVKQRGESRVLPVLLSERSAPSLVSWLRELPGDASALAGLADSFGETPAEFMRQLIPRIEQIGVTLERYRGPFAASQWTLHVAVPLRLTSLLG
jgi:hypothetical protein